MLPDSPLQLLRYFTSDAYQQEQREQERKVRESYQVCAAGGRWLRGPGTLFPCTFLLLCSPFPHFFSDLPDIEGRHAERPCCCSLSWWGPGTVWRAGPVWELHQLQEEGCLGAAAGTQEGGREGAVRAGGTGLLAWHKLVLNLRLWCCVQVLEGCPWVAPRPLYVLATSQPGREEALTYTLRTLRPRPELEDELGRVLGRERPGGGPLISCGEVVDGVVAFEEEGDAERYGALLEAEGRPEVRNLLIWWLFPPLGGFSGWVFRRRRRGAR